MSESQPQSSTQLPPHGILGREFLPEEFRDTFGPRADEDAQHLVKRLEKTKAKVDAIYRDVRPARQGDQITELMDKEVGFLRDVGKLSITNVGLKVEAAQQRITTGTRPSPPVTANSPARAVQDEARRDRLMKQLEGVKGRDTRGQVVKAWASQGDITFIDLLDYLPLPVRLSLLTEDDIRDARLLSFQQRNPDDFNIIEGAIAALNLLRSNLKQFANAAGNLGHRLATDVEPELLVFMRGLEELRVDLPEPPQNLSTALALLELDAA